MAMSIDIIVDYSGTTITEIKKDHTQYLEKCIWAGVLNK